MLIFCQAVFSLIWIGSVLGMLAGFPGVASSDAGGPGVFVCAFQVFLASTVVLLLCHIASSLERVAPKPRPATIDRVSPTL